MDVDYLQQLLKNEHYLPKKEFLLAAFSQPLSSCRYILLGESPYPRLESANGYAFWDNAVTSLWSGTGLSKAVNRATSLRNFIKMLLHARGDLDHDFSQDAIAKVDKTSFHQTAAAFFSGLMRHGFLLLNASLVYSEAQVPYHARHWQTFIQSLLDAFTQQAINLQWILLGRIAQQLPVQERQVALRAEHPYNLSFITRPEVVAFFEPMDLLVHYEKIRNQY
jgi:uracil-DNA glycosylase